MLGLEVLSTYSSQVCLFYKCVQFSVNCSSYRFQTVYSILFWKDWCDILLFTVVRVWNALKGQAEQKTKRFTNCISCISFSITDPRSYRNYIMPWSAWYTRDGWLTPIIQYTQILSVSPNPHLEEGPMPHLLLGG